MNTINGCISSKRKGKTDQQKIAALYKELDLFSAEAEQLDELLTAGLAGFWSGPAFDACQAESRDNREIMLEAIGRFRSMLESVPAQSPAPQHCRQIFCSRRGDSA